MFSRDIIKSVTFTKDASSKNISIITGVCRIVLFSMMGYFRSNLCTLILEMAHLLPIYHPLQSIPLQLATSLFISAVYKQIKYKFAAISPYDA